jgi:endonuclease YncB( thermonuclease family)
LLSHCRAPRLGNAKGDGYELWAHECKECLRSRIIGRRVRIIVDYEKSFGATHFTGASVDASKASSMRYFATVKALPSMRNVALMLLQEGLVTCSTRVTAATALVSPARSAANGKGAPSHLSERNYSCEFESAGYLIAEAEAAAKGRGLHGSSPPPGLPVTANSPGVTDFTLDTKRAKPFVLQLIQKAAALPTPPSSSSGVDARAAGVCYYRGAVEFVYSGSRIKVLIPSENCLLSLTLAQVRCPLPSRAASHVTAASSSSSSSSAPRQAEPLSDESRAFTRRHVMQRTVELRVDGVDMNGIALGRLYVQVQVAPPPGMPTTPSGGALNKPPLAPSFMIRPYAVILVGEGLARVDRKFAPPINDPASEKEMLDLLAAQEAAMAARKGLWSIPGNVEAEQEANAPPPPPPSTPAPADAEVEDENDESVAEVEVEVKKDEADAAVAPAVATAAMDTAVADTDTVPILAAAPAAAHATAPATAPAPATVTAPVTATATATATVTVTAAKTVTVTAAETVAATETVTAAETVTVTEVATDEAAAAPEAAPTAASAASEAVPIAASAASEAVPTAASAASEAVPTAASAASEAVPTAASAASEAVPTAASAASEATPIAASAASESTPTAATDTSEAVPTAASAASESTPTAASAATEDGADTAEPAVVRLSFATPEAKTLAKSDVRAKVAGGGGGGGGIKPSGPQLRGDEEKVVVRLSAGASGTSFFVHPQTETRQKQLLGLQSLLEEFRPDAAGRHAVDAGCVPKRGQLLLGLVDGDRAPDVGAAASQEPMWYRCRVEDVVTRGDSDSGDTELRVQFIDFGSRTAVALDEVAVLDGSNGHPPSNSGLHAKYFATSALATECLLAFLAGPDADDDGDGSLANRAVEFLGDEVCNKDLTMQVLGQVREGDKGRAGAGPLLVALYDDGGAGASSSDEHKTNGKPTLFLSDPDFQEPAEEAGAGAQAGAPAGAALSAASPWGTRFTWGSSGNLGSTSEVDAAGAATGTGSGADDAESLALQHSVSEMSLGDIIAAEEAAAAAALKSPIHTGSKATSLNDNSSNGNGNGGDERIVSVNEKVLMEGLARLSRSATRLLPRGNSDNNSNNNSNSNGASSSSDGGSGGGGGIGGKRVPRPPSLTPLATALYEHMLEAQATARQAHLNMYRYGDPPESDDERDTDRDVKGKDKK